jgi:hypothetical protein
VQDVRVERDKLQSEFNIITKQPFFKREMDESTFQQINTIGAKVEEREKQIKEAKANILKSEETMRRLMEEQRGLKMERDTYHDEIERLRI